MPKTGEKPCTGRYCCDNCHTAISIDNIDDTLPPCPKCTNTEYSRC